MMFMAAADDHDGDSWLVVVPLNSGALVVVVTIRGNMELIVVVKSRGGDGDSLTGCGTLIGLTCCCSLAVTPSDWA